MGMEDSDDTNFKMVMGVIDEYGALRDICNRLYIARNISLSVEGVEDCLKEIDNIFKDKDNFN